MFFLYLLNEDVFALSISLAIFIKMFVGGKLNFSSYITVGIELEG